MFNKWINLISHRIFIRKLTISIPIKRITPQLRSELLKELKANKGKKGLAINLIDYDHNYAVEHISRKFKVDVNPGLLDFLTTNNLDYKIDAEVSF